MENKPKLNTDNFYQKHQNLGSISSSNFYANHNKSDNYPTLIQMLKNDLMSIQDMINNNASDIKMYKILSKSNELTKKLTEIEASQNTLQSTLNKISDESLDKIASIYGCNNANNLIKKIYVENAYNELLLKKICDYFVLMKLVRYKDDSYKESLSKILPIREYMEKDSNLGNEKWRDKEKITVVKNQAKNSSEIKPKIEYKLSPEDQSSLNEYNNILSALTLEDIVYKGDKASSIISHITLLFDNFVNNEIEGFKEKMRCVIEEHSEFESEYNEIKSLRNLIDFSFKISGKIISDNKRAEVNEEAIKAEFLKMRQRHNEEAEKNKAEIERGKGEIKELQQALEKKERVISGYQADVKRLELKFEKLSSENRELSERVLKSNNSTFVTSENNENFNENKTDNNNNNEIYSCLLSKVEGSLCLKLKEENNELKNDCENLSGELNHLKVKYDLLLKEKEQLKCNLDSFHEGLNADSYEKALLEQFDEMKEAFEQKLSDSHQELEDMRKSIESSNYSMKIKLDELNTINKELLKKIMDGS